MSILTGILSGLGGALSDPAGQANDTKINYAWQAAQYQGPAQVYTTTITINKNDLSECLSCECPRHTTYHLSNCPALKGKQR